MAEEQGKTENEREDSKISFSERKFELEIKEHKQAVQERNCMIDLLKALIK